MMKGVIEEYKEISPMFPRLHVKDAEKGGPKAPPRNKMALYEQFSIPSQSFSSGQGSSSLFPLPLRNCTIPTSSSYLSQIGGNQNIQFSSSIAPSILSEKIQAYNSRTINFLNSAKNSMKTIDGEDASFITLGSPHVKSSSCVIIQNDKDEEKPASCNLSCSLKSINILTKVVNIPEALELKSAQYRKNHFMEEEEQEQEQEQEEPPPYSLDGSKSINEEEEEEEEEEHRSLNEEIGSISVDLSLKTSQKDHADFGEKINLRDHCMEKPEVSGTIDEESWRNYDELNKIISECGYTPDHTVRFLGPNQFWRTRKTMIRHQRIFLLQVFELHRLTKVQRSLAESPHILLEPNFGRKRASLKMPTPLQLISEYVPEQRKYERFNSRRIEVENIPLPLPYISNISKRNPSHLLGHDHHLGNHALASTDKHSRQSPSIVYPSSGNQWLVPVMSPSEGLVYKPMIAPYPPNACPPNALPSNAGIITPLYGSGSTNFNPVNKEVLDVSAIPQNISILSGSSLPQLLPPFVRSSYLHNRSISASAAEQIPENHHSFGEVNSAILYQSQSNMSSQISQVMSTRNISTVEDTELQISTDSSPPSKRMKGDVLPLFPVAPTFRSSTSSSEDGNSQVENQSRVIKALPHNPKAASESAARIYKSIQEERKRL